MSRVAPRKSAAKQFNYANDKHGENRLSLIIKTRFGSVAAGTWTLRRAGQLVKQQTIIFPRVGCANVCGTHPKSSGLAGGRVLMLARQRQDQIAELNVVDHRLKPVDAGFNSRRVHHTQGSDSLGPFSLPQIPAPRGEFKPIGLPGCRRAARPQKPADFRRFLHQSRLLSLFGLRVDAALLQ